MYGHVGIGKGECIIDVVGKLFDKVIRYKV